MSQTTDASRQPLALNADERGIAAVQPRRSVVWRRFRENKLAVAGLIVIVLLYGVAIVAPLISRYDPNILQPGARSKPPSAEHWLGTDRNTRDVYARLIVGARVSLSVGFTAVLIIMSVGTALGAIAGFFGGWVDALIMRFTDILLSIPQILLLISAAALFKASLQTTVIVIGLTSWPGAARLVRGQFLSLRNQEFVTAARAIGATPAQIIRRHLFPNTLAVIIVEATLWLSYAILLEAALSYLGLGAQPPKPSWGAMLSGGRRFMETVPSLAIFPGLAIMVTVLGSNLIGDALRDILDPRLRR